HNLVMRRRRARSDTAAMTTPRPHLRPATLDPMAAINLLLAVSAIACLLATAAAALIR
ncbi:MAG: hypothetical protein QOH14_3291, partial [Pseudonocardiales bacterium]|nr:hypothetical protein [Pseudonocardiales bacterium]